MNNPYLDAVSAPVFEAERDQIATRHGVIVAALDGFLLGFLRREILTNRYAWTIPTEHVVRRLAQLSPICDMGCGTGPGCFVKLALRCCLSIHSRSAAARTTGIRIRRPNHSSKSRARTP